MPEERTVFVTVGTTRFDALVLAALRREVQAVLRDQGYTKVLIQKGNSDVQDVDKEDLLLPTSLYRFKPSLSSDVSSASLVISHAGAGTCLEAQAARRPHVVVVNEELMGNHQAELAERLSRGGHLLHCVPSRLAQTLERLPEISLSPLPEGDPSAFAAILDQVVEDIYEKKKED